VPVEPPQATRRHLGAELFEGLRRVFGNTYLRCSSFTTYATPTSSLACWA
jgi:hypothetical protein